MSFPFLIHRIWPAITFLIYFQLIFNPSLPQCAFWKTINSYFVDIATFSIFGPNHILHLAARSRQSHRVSVKSFQLETRKSLTAIQLERFGEKSNRVALKVMQKLHPSNINDKYCKSLGRDKILHLCVKFHTFSLDTFLCRRSTSVLQRRT